LRSVLTKGPDTLPRSTDAQ